MANIENYRGEGDIVFFNSVASATGGDINAGDMVIINSLGNSTKGTSTVMPITGVTSNQFFAGVADNFLSGGKRGLNIITRGVFEFDLQSAANVGTGYIGDPVVATKAQEVALMLSGAGATGQCGCGNIVGLPGPGMVNAHSGKKVLVRISPSMFHNWVHNSPTALCTAGLPMSFPQSVAKYDFSGCY